MDVSQLVLSHAEVRIRNIVFYLVGYLPVQIQFEQYGIGTNFQHKNFYMGSFCGFGKDCISKDCMKYAFLKSIPLRCDSKLGWPRFQTLAGPNTNRKVSFTLLQ